MKHKHIIVGVLVLLVALVLSACAGAQGPEGPAGPAGPAGPEGPAGPPGPAGVDGSPLMSADLTCTQCHNDTTIITGKKAQWEDSTHGQGEAFVRGSRSSCAGCHSGGGFKAMVAAGLMPNEVESGDPNPTHQDCRTCHMIHTSYTGEDWGLTTTEAVTLYAFEGVTYDGGAGNLCANCHQPRRVIAEADGDGNIEITSTHWGPHHGPQTAMLLGVGGAGEEGSPSAHATMVADTCVACHVGENDDHSFEPNIAACQSCHADIEDFDFSGLQTDVDEMLSELLELLEYQGSYHDGHPVVGFYPAGIAQATWNYIMVSVEDASHGVHNPAYTKSLLEYSIQAAQPAAEVIAACAELAEMDTCTLAPTEEGGEDVEGVCTAVVDMLVCVPAVEEAEAGEGD